MPSPGETSRHATALNFNKEIIFGECGSLLAAYLSAFAAAHFTRRPSLISGAVVAGTLVGGTLFWTTARILHRRAASGLSLGALASDISYFTPAAIVLGFVLYDPAIFLGTRFLLMRDQPVALAVALGQAFAFALFLAGMNAYRVILATTRGKRL